MRLKYGDKVWVKTSNNKGELTICKRGFHSYQNDGSLIIEAYDRDYLHRYEEQDYGKTWALTKEELEK